MTAHYVYRVFDRTDELIYIGCTQSLVARMANHKSSWWGYQGWRVVAKVYPTKAQARTVEREAIRAERPRWNLSHLPKLSDWTERDYLDFITAAANLPGAADYRKKRIENVTRHYEARFGRALVLPAEESVA